MRIKPIYAESCHLPNICCVNIFFPTNSLDLEGKIPRFSQPSIPGNYHDSLLLLAHIIFCYVMGCCFSPKGKYCILAVRSFPFLQPPSHPPQESLFLSIAQHQLKERVHSEMKISLLKMGILVIMPIRFVSYSLLRFSGRNS